VDFGHTRLIPSRLELIGQALQEQHAEDEFLVLRRIHFAAQNVAGSEEQILEFG
jgi:hypothetical protein